MISVHVHSEKPCQRRRAHKASYKEPYEEPYGEGSEASLSVWIVSIAAGTETVGIENAYFGKVPNIFDVTELKMRKIFKTALICSLGIGFLTACQHNGTASRKMAGATKMAAVEASQTQTIVNLKDVLDASAENIPTLPQLAMR